MESISHKYTEWHLYHTSVKSVKEMWKVNPLIKHTFPNHTLTHQKGVHSFRYFQYQMRTPDLTRVQLIMHYAWPLQTREGLGMSSCGTELFSGVYILGGRTWMSIHILVCRPVKWIKKEWTITLPWSMSVTSAYTELYEGILCYASIWSAYYLLHILYRFVTL